MGCNLFFRNFYMLHLSPLKFGNVKSPEEYRNNPTDSITQIHIMCFLWVVSLTKCSRLFCFGGGGKGVVLREKMGSYHDLYVLVHGVDHLLAYVHACRFMFKCMF